MATLVSLAGALAVRPAVGCEVFTPIVNQRIDVAADGSFENAGPGDDWSGRAIQDVGGGLVVQRQLQGYCLALEFLVLADCFTGRVVDLLGQGDPMREMAPRLLDRVLYPTGPLAIRQGDTFDDIIRTAVSLSIDVESTLTNLAEYRAWDRPDPFLGCKLFYPESPGGSR